MLLPSTHNANSLLINGEDEGHFIYSTVIASVVVYLPAQFSFLMVFFSGGTKWARQEFGNQKGGRSMKTNLSDCLTGVSEDEVGVDKCGPERGCLNE